MIFAIDPGPTESAYVAILEKSLKPFCFAKLNNNDLIAMLEKNRISIAPIMDDDKLAIEMVASYGMSVGSEVFETCVWIGRFWQAITNIGEKQLIYRKDEKMNLCYSMKAKDTNIRQALIDRFGDIGTKKNPGWFYGFKKDIWQAYAVGVTYHDLYLKNS